MHIGKITDFINMRGDNLTFNGQSYPVNRTALNTLKRTYKEIISIIHNDYAVNDANFVAQQARDRKSKQIQKFM